MTARKGQRHHLAKLSAVKVRHARRLHEQNPTLWTIAALARKYDISRQAMRSAIRGITWGHV